jgi:type IV pilus assembly protein PilB
MEDKLLKLLHDEHVITDEQYQQIIQECEKSHVSSDIALEQLGILDEPQLLGFLSEKFRMPVVDWEAYKVDQELLELVPEHVATKYTIFPYSYEQGKRQGKITLAIANPSNIVASDDISFMTGCIVKTEVSSIRAIRQAIKTYYKGKRDLFEKLDVLEQQELISPKEEFPLGGIAELDALLPELVRSIELTEEESDAFAELDRDHPSTKLLLDLFDMAVERGFSEIHIEPYGQEHRVRFNLYGVLQKHTLIPDQVGRGIGVGLRRIAHRVAPFMPANKEHVPWTASFYTPPIRGKVLTIVVSFYPTPFGEKILLKIKDGSSFTKIDELGIDEKSLKLLERILTKPQGLLLLMSPPGQGKTTTLQTILRRFSQSEEMIVSLEYPVESLIPGVHYIPFSSQMSYQEWHSLLSYRAPELVALENAESPLKVQLAFELASSALVLASVNALDFADGLCTFLSTFIAAFGKQAQEVCPLIVDTINGFVSQRLVRTICPHCKEKLTLSEQDIEFLRWLTATQDDFSATSVYSGKGCHECMETGYSGQSALFEINKFDKGLKRFLIQNLPISAFQIRQFFTELSQDIIKKQAFQMILDGTASLSEIRRSVVR